MTEMTKIQRDALEQKYINTQLQDADYDMLMDMARSYLEGQIVTMTDADLIEDIEYDAPDILEEMIDE